MREDAEIFLLPRSTRFLTLLFSCLCASLIRFRLCCAVCNKPSLTGALQHGGLEIRVLVAHVPQALQLRAGAVRGGQRRRALEPRAPAAGPSVQVGEGL